MIDIDRRVGRPREFRWLWFAQIVSRIGDQFARVAVAVLVFERTGSAGATAATYAVSYLPPLLAAPFLASLADQFPRRTVAVASDCARGVLVTVLAVPGLPLAVAVVTLAAAAALQPLSSAARNAILARMFTGTRYRQALAAINATDTAAQVAGFVVGGLLIAAVGGTETAMIVDAATFATSAIVLRLALGEHRSEPTGHRTTRSRTAGPRAVFANPIARESTLQVWLYGLYLAPEALAVPVAQQHSLGSGWAGVLMAADPVGATVGTLALSRRARGAGPVAIRGRLATAAGAVLLASALVHQPVLLVALWTAAGACSAYLIFSHAAVAEAVPDKVRGTALGMVSAGLQTAQGAGVVIAGLFATWLQPTGAVAACGGCGALLALILRRLHASKRIRFDSRPSASPSGARPGTGHPRAPRRSQANNHSSWRDVAYRAGTRTGADQARARHPWS